MAILVFLYCLSGFVLAALYRAYMRVKGKYYDSIGIAVGPAFVTVLMVPLWPAVLLFFACAHILSIISESFETYLRKKGF